MNILGLLSKCNNLLELEALESEQGHIIFGAISLK